MEVCAIFSGFVILWQLLLITVITIIYYSAHTPGVHSALQANKTDVRARQLPAPAFTLLRKQQALRQWQDWQCEDLFSEHKDMYIKLNAILTN